MRNGKLESGRLKVENLKVKMKQWKVSYDGESPPRGSTPNPFVHHFDRKATAFIYLFFFKKRYPFDIPT